MIAFLLSEQVRLVIVIIAVVAFALLGARDVATGNLGVGIASLMLAAANAILLTR